MYIILAAVLWGCMGIFVRGMGERGLSSMDMVAVRALVTTVGIFLFLLIYNRKKLRVKRKDIWCFLGTGIASVVFFNFCYFTTILHTSLAIAATMLYTAPAFVVLLATLLFKEKLNVSRILGVLLAFFGCCLVTGVFTQMGSINIEGILLGLGAGLGYALYSIFSRFAIARGYDSVTITFYTFLFALIGAVPFTDMRAVGSCFTKSISDTLFVVGCVVVTTILPYVLYTKGLTVMDAGKAAVLANVEPVVATMIGICFYREQLDVSVAGGIVLVLAAACMVAFPVKEKRN